MIFDKKRRKRVKKGIYSNNQKYKSLHAIIYLSILRHMMRSLACKSNYISLLKRNLNYCDAKSYPSSCHEFGRHELVAHHLVTL